MESSLINAFAAIAAAILTVFFVDRIRAKADDRRSRGEFVKTQSEALRVYDEIEERKAKRAATTLDDCFSDLDSEKRKNERLVSLINYLRVGIARLIQQLRDANLEPVWKPTAEDFGDEPTLKERHS